MWRVAVATQRTPLLPGTETAPRARRGRRRRLTQGARAYNETAHATDGVASSWSRMPSLKSPNYSAPTAISASAGISSSRKAVPPSNPTSFSRGPGKDAIAFVEGQERTPFDNMEASFWRDNLGWCLCSHDRCDLIGSPYYLMYCRGRTPRLQTPTCSKSGGTVLTNS